MKKTIILGILLLGLQAAWSLMDAQQPLRFNREGTFKIVQFTDIHWVPGDPASQASADCMRKILEEEKPDLVVYTGDLVAGKPAREALEQLLEPVVSRKLPFAVTWGNHDDEQDLTREQLSACLQSYSGNLTSTVKDIPGVTNYILPIFSSRDHRTAAVLYVFDSQTYSTLPKVKGYGWIHSEQIAWYSRTSTTFTRQNGGNPLPSIAFFHIPIPEYNEAVQDEQTMFWGIRKERACAPLLNTGLYAAMRQAGDIMGVLVGHDHVNDYVVNWQGILLGYGRYTGGATTYHDIPGGNGARIIELKEGSRSFKTWIRLNEGSVLQRVDYPQDFK